jgi:hypothetical protein
MGVGHQGLPMMWTIVSTRFADESTPISAELFLRRGRKLKTA